MIYKHFYTKLFKSAVRIKPSSSLQGKLSVPTILISEVEKAINLMKNGKAPKKDNITSEILKFDREQHWKILVTQFSPNLGKRKISLHWKELKTILKCKKRARKDLKNYHLICLLS